MNAYKLLITLCFYWIFSISQVALAVEDKNVERDKENLNKISRALDLFYADCGFYPSEGQGLVALIEEPQVRPICDRWGPGPYVEVERLTSPWGHEYVYRSSHNDFEVTSYGRDGQKGGLGLDGDISR